MAKAEKKADKPAERCPHTSTYMVNDQSGGLMNSIYCHGCSQKVGSRPIDW